MDLKKTIVVLGSARKNGNTSSIVSQKLEGCEIIDLLDYQLDHYTYDYSRRNHDDFLLIVEKLLKFDQIIFATPVYWYAMSGQLKVFFDKMTELITTSKSLGRRLAGKSVRVLACGTDEVLPFGFDIPFKLTAKYFDMNFITTDYYQTLD